MKRRNRAQFSDIVKGKNESERIRSDDWINELQLSKRNKKLETQKIVCHTLNN